MGGKQQLSPQIIQYMADHKVYIEPFFGSGAVFFNKGYKEVSNNSNYREVIGDLDFNVVNFFEQLRNNYTVMMEKLQYYEYSETLYQKAKTTKDYYKNASDIDKACLFFFNIFNSFAGILNGGFAYGKKTTNNCKKFLNQKNNLELYAKRLTDCYIFHKPYNVLVDRFDSKESLFYFDPPYRNTKKYTIQKDFEFDYDEFAKNIQSIQGKFILSHYKDEWLLDTFKDYYIIDLDNYCSIRKSNGESRQSNEVNECIVLNYNPEKVDLWTGHEQKTFTGLFDEI